MIVFIDENGYIVDIGYSTKPNVTMREVDEEMFKDKCDEFIKGYAIDIVYKTEIVDGKEVYVLDEDGNKIEIGQSVYPYIDYNQLLFIQQKHDFDKLVLSMANVIGGAE